MKIKYISCKRVYYGTVVYLIPIDNIGSLSIDIELEINPHSGFYYVSYKDYRVSEYFKTQEMAELELGKILIFINSNDLPESYLWDGKAIPEK